LPILGVNKYEPDIVPLHHIDVFTMEEETEHQA
jgi:tRNA A37 threonylcarbamoyladenosine biosynthesis protein TsaE